MRRLIAFPGVPRLGARSASASCACLVFVLLAAVAFWAGALWISDNVLTLLYGVP